MKEEFSVVGGVLPFSMRQLLGEEGHGRLGAFQDLLQNRTHVEVRCNHSKRDWSLRARINKFRERGGEILGTAEGGVQNQRPG